MRATANWDEMSKIKEKPIHHSGDSLLLTEKLLNEGDYTTALKKVEKTLKESPTNKNIYSILPKLINKLPTDSFDKSLLDKALKEHPKNPHLLYSCALINRANNEFDKEMACIEYATATQGITGSTKHIAYRELALSADQCGRYDHAYYYFLKANHINFSINKDKASNFNSMLNTIEQLKNNTKNVNKKVEKDVDKIVDNYVDNYKDPIFILSFSPHDLELPTKLLSKHPELHIASNNIIQNLLLENNSNNFPTNTLSLTPAQLEDIRSKYFKTIAKIPDTKNKQIIDITHSNCLYLQPISQLFPTAKFIFIEREIPDAIFKAFTAKYLPSIFTLHCRSLQTTAKLYTAWQTLIQTTIKCRQIDPLHLNMEQFEQSIRNFTGRILHTVNIPWHKQVKDLCEEIQKDYNQNHLNWSNYTYYVKETLRLTAQELNH